VNTQRTVITFDVLDSTSAYLRTHSPDYPDLTVIRARDQRKGHGQRGRPWISDPDQNVLFSVLVKRVALDRLGSLMTVVRDVLLDFYRSRSIHATFKEPNDIMAGPFKITGILIESRSGSDAFSDVVIGIGMNVNQTDFDGLPATSMRLQTGKTYDCDEVFEDITHRLLDVLGSHEDR